MLTLTLLGAAVLLRSESTVVLNYVFRVKSADEIPSENSDAAEQHSVPESFSFPPSSSAGMLKQGDRNQRAMPKLKDVPCLATEQQ